MEAHVPGTPGAGPGTPGAGAAGGPTHTTPTTTATAPAAGRTTAHTPNRRRSTETKQAFKTTEFIAYVAILIGLFIAGALADADEGSDVDGFGANLVWLYAVILTFGYMVSRGLAKSGSREPYDADRD